MNKIFSMLVLSIFMTSFLMVEISEAKSWGSRSSSFGSRRSSYVRPKSNPVYNIHKSSTVHKSSISPKTTTETKMDVSSTKPSPKIQTQKVESSPSVNKGLNHSTTGKTPTQNLKKSSSSSMLVPLGLLYLATRTSPNHKKVPKSCVCSESGIPTNCPSDVICKKNPNTPSAPEQVPSTK